MLNVRQQVILAEDDEEEEEEEEEEYGFVQPTVPIQFKVRNP